MNKTISLLPPGRPMATRAEIEKHALREWRAQGNEGPLPDVYVVAVPSYFWNTMGRQKRGRYDDAFFVVSKWSFAAFNGSTDPSIYRAEIATLKCPQVVWYRPGIHRYGKKGAHAAFRQDGAVTVHRDKLVKPAGYRHATRGVSLGDGYWTDRGYAGTFWTNLHRGGRYGTSSEGCLTVPPAQWTAFHALVMTELKRAGLKRFPVVLVPGPVR